jgi:hypothetical protein
MEYLKVFADHFYFSLVVVLVGLIVLYIALVGIGSDFAVSDHIWTALGTWMGASCGLAAVLTYRTIRHRPRDHIMYTRRRQ